MPPPRHHPTPRRVQHGAAGHLQLLLLRLLRRRQQQLLLVVLVHVRHRLQQEELWYLLQQVAHHPPRRGGHGVVSAVTISVLVVGVVIVSAIFLRILGLYLLVLLGSHGVDGRRFGWKKGRLFVRLRAPYPASNFPKLILRKTDWKKEISSETGKGQNLPAAAAKGARRRCDSEIIDCERKAKKTGDKEKKFSPKVLF